MFGAVWAEKSFLGVFMSFFWTPKSRFGQVYTFRPFLHFLGVFGLGWIWRSLLFGYFGLFLVRWNQWTSIVYLVYYLLVDVNFCGW